MLTERKAFSNAEMVRAMMAETRQRVTEITGISEVDQFAMEFSAAFAWLRMIGCNGASESMMTATKEFWGFWKMEWHRMNKQFLIEYGRFKYAEPRKWYDYFHSIDDYNKLLDYTEVNYHQVIKELAKQR